MSHLPRCIPYEKYEEVASQAKSCVTFLELVFSSFSQHKFRKGRPGAPFSDIPVSIWCRWASAPLGWAHVLPDLAGRTVMPPPQKTNWLSAPWPRHLLLLAWSHKQKHRSPHTPTPTFSPHAEGMIAQCYYRNNHSAGKCCYCCDIPGENLLLAWWLRVDKCLHLFLIVFCRLLTFFFPRNMFECSFIGVPAKSPVCRQCIASGSGLR